MLSEREPLAEDTRPEELPLDRLASRCREETEKYRKELPSDPRFCLEIFRRALAAQRDDEAWRRLVELYTSLVRAHIPLDSTLVDAQAREDIVQDTWLRFWNASRGGRLKCEVLEKIVSFLILTTRSAVIQYRRKNRRLPDPIPPLFDQADPKNPFSEVDKQIFLERARVVLRDFTMYATFWLKYRYNLPPREIGRILNANGLSWKGRPLTPEVVSELLRQSIRLLAEDPIIRELLGED